LIVIATKDQCDIYAMPGQYACFGSYVQGKIDQIALLAPLGNANRCALLLFSLGTAYRGNREQQEIGAPLELDST
jgi:hypothetical protein